MSITMISKLPIVISIVLFITHASTKQFNINTTTLTNCYASINTCSFTDPNLWGGPGAGLPTSKDTVVIYSTDTQASALYITNSSVALLGISIYGLVSLEISGSFFQVTTLNLNASARIDVFAQSKLQVNKTIIIDGGVVSIDAYSSLVHYSGWLILTAGSSMIANDNATITLASANITGQLSLQPLTNFYAASIFFLSAQTVNALSSFGQAYIYKSDVDFMGGIMGGRMEASGASVSVYGDTSLRSIIANSGSSLEFFGDISCWNISSSAQLLIAGDIQVNLISASSFSIYGLLNASKLNVLGGSNYVKGLAVSNLTLIGSSTLDIGDIMSVNNSINITSGSKINLRQTQASINTTVLTGDIMVNNSQITLINSYTPNNNARFTFLGTDNVISAPSVDVYSFSFVDPSAYVYVMVDVITLDRPIEFQGSFLIRQQFTSSATVTVLGRVAMLSATANIQGSFSAHLGIYLNSTTCTIGNGTSLNGTNLIVGLGSTLITRFVTTVTASVIVYGNLQTSATNPFAITGKYIQRSGVLTINNIRRGLPAMITVVGSASLAGSFVYQAIATASGETVKLPVIVTTQGLTGKFSPPSTSFESFVYDEKNLYVRFSENNAASVCLSRAAIVVLICCLLW